MARTTEQTVESIIREAIEGVVRRAAASIQGVVAAELASARKSLGATRRRGRPGARKAARRPRRQEMTRWVADRAARRVPNFVIEMTGGLDTKKKIVARFGENAAFEKGKPAPAVLKAGGQAASPAGQPKASRTIKAKGPVIRKKARAAASST